MPTGRADPRFSLPLPDNHPGAGDEELHGFHLQDVSRRVIRYAAPEFLGCVSHALDSEIPFGEDLSDLPERKFILIADISNSDVMKDYPAMVNEFPNPNQVQCIFLRNTSATDQGDKFPYDTSGFKGIDQNKYMFFLVPDDLTNLDIVNGQCYNTSIPQNVTFSEQGLPFGLSKKSRASTIDLGWKLIAGTSFVMLFWVLLGEI
jgi:hypothetical protein